MQKKRILIILTLLILLLSVFILTPVSADAPTMEDWVFASFANGTAYCYYTINTVNLQVDSFTIVNNSTQPVLVRIYYDGFTDDNIIWMLYAGPGNTWSAPINNFKFHRLPLDDPDDPGSIRYPNKHYISARYG